MWPLRHRGKLLNVREASATQITGNAEIQNIKQIMGLQHGKVLTLVILARAWRMQLQCMQCCRLNPLTHAGSPCPSSVLGLYR